MWLKHQWIDNETQWQKAGSTHLIFCEKSYYSNLQKSKVKLIDYKKIPQEKIMKGHWALTFAIFAQKCSNIGGVSRHSKCKKLYTSLFFGRKKFTPQRA